MRKIPFAGIELTSQRVRGLRGTSEPPGRPAFVVVAIVFINRQTDDVESPHQQDTSDGVSKYRAIKSRFVYSLINSINTVVV